LVVPRSISAAWVDWTGGDWRSDSGEGAVSVVDWVWEAGTTRLRRLIMDFFIVTGRWTPWSLKYRPCIVSCMNQSE